MLEPISGAGVTTLMNTKLRGTKEYLASMDRYCGFVYAQLTADLLRQARSR